MIGLCVLALLSVLVGDAHAQDAIEPDRPDVTNGTHIVEIGLLQIEMGGQVVHSGTLRSFGSPVTARVGLAEWLEARVSTDGFVTQTDGTLRLSSVGNTSLGAKLRLWGDPGGVPVLSILPTVTFPTASTEKGFNSGDRDYLAAVLTGTDLGRHWHADLNYGIGAIGAGENRPHFVQHLVSVSVSAAATDDFNPYGEIFWLSKQAADGGPITAADAGAIYQLGTRYAIDGGVQFGVHGSHDLSMFGGFSMIVGDVLGGHGVEGRARERQRRGIPNVSAKPK
jgi:hypothetical protein